MRTSRKAQRSARRLFALCAVDGGHDEERIRQVAQRVARSRRRGSPAILHAFLRLVRLDRDRHSAIVESATPLPEMVQDEVRSSLIGRYGVDLSTSFGLDPALIGGMRIKVGSHVYDGSVRARLASLAGRF